jgi:formate dehydrogenase
VEFGASEAEIFEVITTYDRFSKTASSALRLNHSGPASETENSRSLISSLISRSPHAAPAPVTSSCDHISSTMQEGRQLEHSLEPPYILPLWIESLIMSSSPVIPPVNAEAALAMIQMSGLRGMGGSGYLTAFKWRAVKNEPGPRYVVINANEGEPGSFKDRFLLEHAAAQVLTGAFVAATVVRADTIHFYICNEYSDLLEILADTAGRLVKDWPDIELQWRRGAGSYVYGEETALLESIEGRPARPRHKPPFPSKQGLFGHPTLVNNVETLFWVNEILARGSDWYAAHGLRGARGLRLFSLSGRVVRSGVYVAPLGITLSELVAKYCGGMAYGHKPAAFLLGGASGGILPSSMADLPLYCGSLQPYGAELGSASLIVLSQQDDVPQIIGELMKFLAEESCGQCAPCRLGTIAAAKALNEPLTSHEDLSRIGYAMSMGSICGLGQGAGRLLESYVRHFHGGQVP